MSKDRLIIFDTTLRDGEQSPGASMTRDEKIRIARALELMRVDIIEAGFPIASEGDFESVRAVAGIIKDSTVCGLARAKPGDIERAGEAIKPANSGRIHTFLATYWVFTVLLVAIDWPALVDRFSRVPARSATG